MTIRYYVSVMLFLAAGSAAVLPAAETPTRLPAAVWPALEDAAAADAAKRHDALLAVGRDAAAPVHVRALALLGAARTAKNSDEAAAIWQGLAEDAAAPEGCRDEARRCLAESKTHGARTTRGRSRRAPRRTACAAGTRRCAARRAARR